MPLEALRQIKFDRNRPVSRQNDRALRLAAREFAGFLPSRRTSVVVVFRILACSAGYAGAGGARSRAISDRADLDRLLSKPPRKQSAAKLFKAMRRDRDDLFRFVTRRDLPYTNNGCERALRPSVIFRKVTGCFRSIKGATLYAATQSVIATGRLRGLAAVDAIRNALNGGTALKAA